jgi:hypothetical protein
MLPGLARPLNTSKVSGYGSTTKPLQRKAEKPTACDRNSSGRTITLPNGQHLSNGGYPRRTGLYPYNPESPVPLSEKRLSDKPTLLINWLSQSHVDYGVQFSWVVLHVPFKIYDLVLLLNNIS